MAKKLLIGLVVLLVLITGGIGYYSYTLHHQIDRLEDSFATLEGEQSDRIDTLEANIASLQNETLDKLDALKGEIGEALAGFGAIRDEMTTLANDILDITSGLASLNERLTAAETSRRPLNSSGGSPPLR